MPQSRKFTLTLNSYGAHTEFDTEEGAEAAREFLASKGKETGLIEIVIDHMRDKWTVTQFFRVLVKNEKHELIQLEEERVQEL